MTDQPPYAGGPGGQQQPYGQQQFGNMPSYQGGDGGYQQPQGKNGLAIAALVLGIISLPLIITVYGGLILGVLGVIFGIVAMRKAKRVGGTGRGMAIAGLATGLVGLIVSAILLVYGLIQYNDCKDKLGHAPNSDELQVCIQTK